MRDRTPGGRTAALRPDEEEVPLPLLRSLLFVPATNPDRIPKALASGADAVIVDLEDAVSVERKAEARDSVVRFLEENPDRRGPPLYVRVNGPGTPWMDEDVEGVVRPGLSGIFLPRSQRPEEVSALGDRVGALSKKRTCEAPRLVPIVETALGLLHAFEIVSADSGCAALALGGEDFARDIGAVRTPLGEEIALARMRVVLGARAAGVLPIDTVYTDFRDEAGLSRDAERARRLGFAGKLVIHPRQVGTVNRAFSPSSIETRRAREVVAAFEAARERGEAVAQLEGRMLDPAVVDQARRVVELAEEQSRVEALS